MLIYVKDKLSHPLDLGESIARVKIDKALVIEGLESQNGDFALVAPRNSKLVVDSLNLSHYMRLLRILTCRGKCET